MINLIDVNILPKLIQGKNAIFLDEIPFPFQKDLLNFITGETLSGCIPGKNGKDRIRIGNNLYKNWLNKIWKHGFDYDISLIANEQV